MLKPKSNSVSFQKARRSAPFRFREDKKQKSDAEDNEKCRRFGQRWGAESDEDHDQPRRVFLPFTINNGGQERDVFVFGRSQERDMGDVF